MFLIHNAAQRLQQRQVVPVTPKHLSSSVVSAHLKVSNPSLALQVRVLQ